MRCPPQCCSFVFFCSTLIVTYTENILEVDTLNATEIDIDYKITQSMEGADIPPPRDLQVALVEYLVNALPVDCTRWQTTNRAVIPIALSKTIHR